VNTMVKNLMSEFKNALVCKSCIMIWLVVLQNMLISFLF
jgi:hypothetical protein